MAGEQRRLGALPGALLGHPAPRLAVRGDGLRRGLLRRIAPGPPRPRRRGAGRPSPPVYRRRRPALLPGGLRRRDAARPRGDRHLVRLGLDAVRAVPPPLRGVGGVQGAVPGRLHLRGNRPDPGLVLLAARRLDPGLRPHELPELRLPRPDPRPGGPEDVEEPRQRCRPVGGPLRPRRGRAPLVLLHRPAALGGLPLLDRDRGRGGPPVPEPALEHLLVLGALRERGEAGPGHGPAGAGARRRFGPRQVDPVRAPGAERAGRGRDGRLQLHPRRAGARAVRRAPLELVRAPLPPALLGGRSRRARHAPPLPARAREDARPVHPVRRATRSTRT